MLTKKYYIAKMSNGEFLCFIVGFGQCYDTEAYTDKRFELAEKWEDKGDAKKIIDWVTTNELTNIRFEKFMIIEETKTLKEEWVDVYLIMCIMRKT